MTAMDNVADGNRYARCIQSSKRVHWEIDEDVIRGVALMPLTSFCPMGFRSPTGLPHYRPTNDGS